MSGYCSKPSRFAKGHLCNMPLPCPYHENAKASSSKPKEEVFRQSTRTTNVRVRVQYVDGTSWSAAPGAWVTVEFGAGAADPFGMSNTIFLDSRVARYLGQQLLQAANKYDADQARIKKANLAANARRKQALRKGKAKP
jgi:hypothetical protein